MMKKIIGLFVVGLFFSTTICTASTSSKTPTTQEDKLLTIYLPGITDDNYLMQKLLTENDTQTFSNKINQLLNLINTTISEDSPGKMTVTAEEWGQIEFNVKDVIDSIKSLDENFPNIDFEQLIVKIVNSFLNPVSSIFILHPLISAGIGFSWIPFYDYETFMGIVVRPIFTRYVFGALRSGGFLQRYFMIGSFPVYTIRFIGIFINLGGIGQNKIIGPTIYIGTAARVRTMPFFQL